MDNLNCLIIDDEPLCIEALSTYINKVPYLNLIGTYNDPADAIDFISSTNAIINILFLDVEMPSLSGLDVAAVIRNKVDKLVFVTAHAKYSLEAYDVLCNQYLLKPFTFQKFVNTIDKLIGEPMQIAPNTDFIFIKDSLNGKYVKLTFGEIICVTALEHYVIVYTNDNKYIQNISMKEAENALGGAKGFIRIHKSYLVSKKHIISVNGNTVLLSNKLEANIGATYKQGFKTFLNDNTFR